MSPQAHHRPADERAEADLRSFWKVYLELRPGLEHELAEILRRAPALARAAASMDPETRERQNRETDTLMAAALERGEWDAYEARIRSDAAEWARQAVPFSEWHALLAGSRRAILTGLVRRANGDAGRLETLVSGLGHYLDLVTALLGEAYLETKEALILQQQEAIRELSTPVFQIRSRLLIVPVVGVVDTHRARQITEALLDAVHRYRARAATLDVTGVPMVDSGVANHLVQMVSAAGLMGCEVIVSGLSPEISRTLVSLGADLHGVRTVVDLQEGIEAAEAILAGPEGAAVAEVRE